MGFKIGWKNLGAKTTARSNGFYAMRDWQEEFFDEMKNEKDIILNAPTGSGKSFAMCGLSAYRMKQNDNLKCIFAVPQTIIAPGFREANLILPNKEKIAWLAQHDLCAKMPDEGTIAYLINWLKGPYATLADRVLICTHATLVAVYKRLKETNQRKLLKNLLMWIDEAHHLKNAEIEGFEDVVVSNGIGELVTYAHSQPSIQVGLATASFFRGDKTALLPEKIEKQFARYNLPYDKYLSSMKYLRSFSFDFLLCGNDYPKAIQKILKQKKCKDIIYIPHVGSKHSTDKHEERKSIVDKYKRTYGGKIVNKSNGLTSLIGKNGEFKICDLVDEDRRNEKKEYIGKIKDKDDLDAIITLGMFKEGANWIYANRSIVVGPRASMVEILQIIGRLLRDAKDKDHVEIIQLLPFSLDQTDEKFEDNLNDYLKAIYASLILENILNPVQIKLKSERKGKGKNKGESKDFIGDVLDDSEQLSLMEEVGNNLLTVISNSDETINLWDEYQKIIPTILQKYGVNNNVEEISRQLWGRFAKRTLQMQGIDVSHIDFDILQKASPLDFLLRYTSGSCGIDTFKKLREIISKIKTAEEWVVIAEKLAEENGGILPCESWLYDNGYSGLTRAMKLKPELFYQIDQEWKGGNSLNEWKEIAKNLSKENNGILPKSRWLIKNGYSGLDRAIRKNKHFFSDLVQEKHEYKTKEDALKEIEKYVVDGKLLSAKQIPQWILGWKERYPKDFKKYQFACNKLNLKKAIQLANKLTEENGGKLPSTSFLNKHYCGLYKFIIKHPNSFNHFPRDKFKNTLLEAVKEAEELEKEHNKLPNPKWLQKNGYSWLNARISKNPEMFLHIQKNKIQKTIEEYVLEAEQIASQNNGTLPHKTLLAKTNSNLVKIIRENPKYFSHIKQEIKSGKTREEQVLIAEKLAQDNNGKLPNNTQLKKNGFASLVVLLKKCPELFAHIEQEKNTRRTKENNIAQIKNLIRENDGIMPSYTQLVQGGHTHLISTLYTYPELFPDFKKYK